MKRAALGGYRVVLRDRAFVALVGVNTVFALASIMLGLALPTVVTEVLAGPGWLSAAVTVVFTAAELLHAPASTALAAALAPARRRGRYLATFQYSFTLASLVAPVFFTSLFAATPAAPWLVMAVLVAISGIDVLRLERAFAPAALGHRDPDRPGAA